MGSFHIRIFKYSLQTDVLLLLKDKGNYSPAYIENNQKKRLVGFYLSGAKLAR